MPHFIPTLACGNMGITGTDVVLFLILVASWIVAACLSFVNFVIIFSVSQVISFRLLHSVILMLYVGLAVFVFNLDKIIHNYVVAMPLGQTLAIVLPLAVTSHFVYLLMYCRRVKRENKKDA